MKNRPPPSHTRSKITSSFAEKRKKEGGSTRGNWKRSSTGYGRGNKAPKKKEERPREKFPQRNKPASPNRMETGDERCQRQRKRGILRAEKRFTRSGQELTEGARGQEKGRGKRKGARSRVPAM